MSKLAILWPFYFAFFLQKLYIDVCILQWIPEMAGCIHLIFYSNMKHVPGVMPVISDVLLSVFFSAKIVPLCVHFTMHLRDGLKYHLIFYSNVKHVPGVMPVISDFEKKSTLAILWPFFMIFWCKNRREICAFHVAFQRWLNGFISYFTTWWHISLR